MSAIDNERLAHWRMRSLRLAGAPLPGPEAVVGWLCAVQSQDYGPAKWSVAMRTTGTTDSAMDELVTTGAILRTHVLRPTWHFVLPADIRWMLEATAPRVQVLNAFPYRSLGLDQALRDKAATVLGEALVGGNNVTRGEAAALWEDAGISVEGQRLPYLLMHAELEQVICSGALRGKQHTYALLDERAPGARRLPHEEALAQLTRRYFTRHGPATAKDFQAWSSLTMAEVHAGLSMVGKELEQLTVGEWTLWFAEPPPPEPPAGPAAVLLQAYDEYFMGYRESRAVVDAAGHFDAPRQGPVANGVVVIDGQVAGHWKRVTRAKTVTFEVGLYTRLTEAEQAALQVEAERFGAHLGRAATVATSIL